MAVSLLLSCQKLHVLAQLPLSHVGLIPARIGRVDIGSVSLGFLALLGYHGYHTQRGSTSKGPGITGIFLNRSGD